MAINVLQELEKRYSQGQQRAQSLSERLSELDQFDQSTILPKIEAPLMKGESPVGKYNSLFGLMTGRKAMASDVSGAQDQNLNLLSQIYQLQKDQEPEQDTLSTKDLIDLQIKARKEGLELDPMTGQLKPIDEKISEDKQQTINLLDDIMGRDFGAITGPTPLAKNWFKPGENAYTKNLVDQLRSRLSVDAREKMKGTGQISDYESKMLEKSVSALNTNLTNEDFEKELRKIRGILSGDGTGNTVDLIDKYWGE